MNDDRQGAGKRRHLFRYILFSLASLLVLSLGFTLIPAEPPVPGPPSDAEIARSSALGDALRLRAAGGRLASQAGDKPAAAAAIDEVVTLLTVQARALLLPDVTGPQPGFAAGAPEAALSVPGLARDLAASGAARLRDAETADDGGMARLLAGVGTAQLLAAERLQTGAAAERLGAGAGGPAKHPEPGTGKADREPAGPCSSPTGADTGSADAARALSAALLAEREAVYAYGAAMSRLAPGAAGPASAFLGSHRVLARDAEDRLLLTCQAVPLQKPGYAIEAEFLRAPAGRLGSLEAGTLALYGDLIALSEGGTREWAVSALHAAAARAVQWGADPGPVPGLAIDAAQLPELAGLSGLTGPPGQATPRPER
ncbi:DUF4439 domain-containing protein [Pseudarthrobacter sp. NPDC092424]|uniref:DUF4439 domain-containing protein n=1 Tax=Pseudarthrobacter sp. NPDC092424 TaxID=3364415 RepID=UPI00380076DA